MELNVKLVDSILDERQNELAFNREYSKAGGYKKDFPIGKKVYDKIDQLFSLYDGPINSDELLTYLSKSKRPRFNTESRAYEQVWDVIRGKSRS
jgi:hypothetical protein